MEAATAESVASILHDADLRGSDTADLQFTRSSMADLEVATQIGQRVRLVHSFALIQYMPGAGPLPLSLLPPEIFK